MRGLRDAAWQRLCPAIVGLVTQLAQYVAELSNEGFGKRQIVGHSPLLDNTRAHMAFAICVGRIRQHALAKDAYAGCDFAGFESKVTEGVLHEWEAAFAHQLFIFVFERVWTPEVPLSHSLNSVPGTIAHFEQITGHVGWLAGYCLLVGKPSELLPAPVQPRLLSGQMVVRGGYDHVARIANEMKKSRVRQIWKPGTIDEFGVIIQGDHRRRKLASGGNDLSVQEDTTQPEFFRDPLKDGPHPDSASLMVRGYDGAPVHGVPGCDAAEFLMTRLCSSRCHHVLVPHALCW